MISVLDANRLVDPNSIVRVLPSATTSDARIFNANSTGSPAAHEQPRGVVLDRAYSPRHGVSVCVRRSFASAYLAAAGTARQEAASRTAESPAVQRVVATRLGRRRWLGSLLRKGPKDRRALLGGRRRDRSAMRIAECGACPPSSARAPHSAVPIPHPGGKSSVDSKDGKTATRRAQFD